MGGEGGAGWGAGGGVAWHAPTKGLSLRNEMFLFSRRTARRSSDSVNRRRLTLNRRRLALNRRRLANDRRRFECTGGRRFFFQSEGQPWPLRTLEPAPTSHPANVVTAALILRSGLSPEPRPRWCLCGQ